MSDSTGERRPSPNPPHRRRQPNYAARRLLASAIAVTVVMLVGLLIWRFVGGDGGGDAVEADWDDVALIDPATGQVETFGTDGQTRNQLDISDRIRQVETAGPQVALITSDAIVLTTIEESGVATFGASTTTPTSTSTATTVPSTATTLNSQSNDDGLPSLPPTSTVRTLTPRTIATTLPPGTTVTDDTGAIRVSIPDDATVERLPVDDELVLVVGRDEGGNILVVRGNGDVIDVGAAAAQTDPLLFLDSVETNPTGSHIAVADARNFQTIVVTSPDEPPMFFADQPLALGGELIATSQVVGDRAEVTLSNLGGDRRTSVSTELAVAGVIADDRLLFVTADGSIARVGPDDDEAEPIGSVTVPGDGAVTAVWATGDGERLVVAGSTFESIVDLDGEPVFTTTFPSATDLVVPSYQANCIVIGDGDDAHSLVRVDDGSTVADLGGSSVVSIADRACAAVTRDTTDHSFQLVTPDNTVALDGLRDAHVAPDGRSLIAITANGISQLIPVTDDGTIGEPIDLRAPTPASIAVEFLDR